MAGVRFLAVLALCLALSVPCPAAEPGELPLRPGETLPQPRQRGLNEVESLPELVVACPVCGFGVSVPDVDKLMRRAAGAARTPRWQLHAASRDADLCPHPGPGKVSFQADVAICPSCGYAAEVNGFARPVPPATAEWVLAVLKPNMTEARLALLGKRADDMTEAEAAAFFNRQDAIPDVLRLEHLRIYALARPSTRLDKAEATWLAAFAARRALLAAPEGEFFAKRRAEAEEAMRKRLSAPAHAPATARDEAEALRWLLEAGRSGRERLAALARPAARLMRIGRLDRLGMAAEADGEMDRLLAACRERYARSEQDPLWRAVSPRASRSYRERELERVRDEILREVESRRELLFLERRHLADAADLLREAIVAGECDARPDEALFHAYLVGEFLRRTGNLPLASEWFTAAGDLAPPESPIARAAATQLRLVREQAGGEAALLSALGQDAAALEKLRKICHDAK